MPLSLLVTFILNLYAIPRHREGATRVNVGRINGGESRNIICPLVKLEAEVRGANDKLCDFVL